MLNSISVDVEEYYHAANIEAAIGRSCWPKLASRVEESTEEILRIFAEANTRGTFFILGNVARRHKALVKTIASAGHEIASHGFRHHIAYEQSEHCFYKDVYYSKCLLEDITGSPVLGYRAPNFSITDKNLWAYDALIRAGYRYDCSLYPTRHPRYGNIHRKRSAEVLERENGKLLVLPLAVAEASILGRQTRFPVAGGAYWRTLPRSYSRWGIARMNSKDRFPAHCYFHPWELDPGQPVIGEMSLINRIRHYQGTSSFASRIEYFLKSFKFTTILDVINTEYDESKKALLTGP